MVVAQLCTDSDAGENPVVSAQINAEKNFAFLEFRSVEETSNVRDSLTQIFGAVPRRALASDPHGGCSWIDRLTILLSGDGL